MGDSLGDGTAWDPNILIKKYLELCPMIKHVQRELVNKLLNLVEI